MTQPKPYLAPTPRYMAAAPTRKRKWIGELVDRHTHKEVCEDDAKHDEPADRHTHEEEGEEQMFDVFVL